MESGIIDIRLMSDIEKISALSLHASKSFQFDDYYIINEFDIINFFKSVLPKIKFITIDTHFQLDGVSHRCTTYTSSNSNSNKVEDSALLEDIANSINNHIEYHFVFHSIKQSGFNIISIRGEFIKDSEAIREMKIDDIIS